ncbi:MAG: hypothetical protein ACRYGI_13255 [Janthinobacterium lividum]
MTKKITMAVAFACALTTVACSDQQTAQQGQASYANDKAGGSNTGAPGYSKPAGN